MSTLEDLAERVERLVLRHEELKRTHGLLEQELGAVHQRARQPAGPRWPPPARASTPCSPACLRTAEP